MTKTAFANFVSSVYFVSEPQAIAICGRANLRKTFITARLMFYLGGLSQHEVDKLKAEAKRLERGLARVGVLHGVCVHAVQMYMVLVPSDIPCLSAFSCPLICS